MVEHPFNINFLTSNYIEQIQFRKYGEGVLLD
jgi:hypothetical protein